MNKLQKEVFESLSTCEWRTQKILLERLQINFNRTYKSRKLRSLIKECRMLYKESCVEHLIIKSNQGYKLSMDLDEINRFTCELIELGQSMVREGQELWQAAQKRKKQCNNEYLYSSYENYCQETIEQLIKNGVFSHTQMIEISKGINARLDYSKIFVYANPKLNPYIMNLARNALAKGNAEKDVKEILRDDMSIENAITFFKLLNQKEMRDIETKKTY